MCSVPVYFAGPRRKNNCLTQSVGTGLATAKQKWHAAHAGCHRLMRLVTPSRITIIFTRGALAIPFCIGADRATAAFRLPPHVPHAACVPTHVLLAAGLHGRQSGLRAQYWPCPFPSPAEPLAPRGGACCRRIRCVVYWHITSLPRPSRHCHTHA